MAGSRPPAGMSPQRMVAENDPRKAAEDLYLTILSRPPTDEESADVARMLSVPAKRQARGRPGTGLGAADLGGVPIQSLSGSSFDDR